MYGLIGRFVAVAGKREELLSILLGSTTSMPGCHAYLVARDTTDAVTIWITEVWEDEASHRASLALPEVRDAITRARPLIESFGEHRVVEPVGGHGLNLPKARG